MKKAAVLGTSAALGIAALLPFFPPLEGLDLAVLDAEMRWLRRAAGHPATVDVVIVGIDEATLEALAEPIALWHPHLGRLFSTLAEAGPAAVGVDLNLPERSYDFVVPGNDRQLLAGLAALRRVAPVVLGIAVDAVGSPRPVYPPYLSVAGPDSGGFVQWQVDDDRVVRGFTERLADDGSSVPTFSGQIVRKLGFTVGEGLIDYTVGPSYRYIPMHEILDGSTADLEGAVVLIGSVLPFVDRHHLPVAIAGWEPSERFQPGVLLHAQALRSMLGRGLIEPAPQGVVVLLSVLAVAIWPLGRRPAIGAVVLVVLMASLVGLSTALLHLGSFLPIAAVAYSAALALGVRSALKLANQARERSRLRRAFAGSVSPGVLSEILDGRLHPGLQGERRHVCILFSDIRGFTAMSEGMEPEQVIGLLNRYFGLWIDVIQGLDGTLDKFLGDGIMAVFGAPKPLDDPGARAFTAAREMLVRLDGLNRDLARENHAPLHIGIGLHAGDVVLGHIGSEHRHEYTAIGDAVNLASRLESLTKETGHTVVCSDAVVSALEDRASFDALGTRPVRGHSPVELFGWPHSGDRSRTEDTDV